jgi:hypothetical protein
MRSFSVFLLALILPAVALPCFGQAGKAELFGTIHDPSDLGVPNAKVTGQEQSTGLLIEAATDQRGEYHLLGLAAGQYVLAVEKVGFRPTGRRASRCASATRSG